MKSGTVGRIKVFWRFDLLLSRTQFWFQLCTSWTCCAIRSVCKEQFGKNHSAKFGDYHFQTPRPHLTAYQSYADFCVSSYKPQFLFVCDFIVPADHSLTSFWKIVLTILMLKIIQGGGYRHPFFAKFRPPKKGRFFRQPLRNFEKKWGLITSHFG